MQLIEVTISTVMCVESKLGILSLLFLPKRIRYGMVVVITSASTLKLIDFVKVVTHFFHIQFIMLCGVAFLYMEKRKEQNTTR